MKKYQNIIIMIILGFVFIMLNACITPIDTEDINDDVNDDYYKTVTVTNGTDTQLAVFYNEVKQENYLGQIEVYADRQEIGLPELNKFYVLRFVRYSDYEYAESDSDLEEVKVIYSELVYSDNIEKYNVTVQGGLLTGDSEIIWENPTDYWVEVRKEGISGQVLDVMPPHSVRKDYIPSGAYDLFPVFKIELYADAGQTEIIGLKDFADLDQVYTFQAISGETHTYMVTESSIPSQHVNGYVVINNQSDNGFRFKNGNTLLISDLGYEVSNSGKSVFYSLEADVIPGKEYTNLNVKTSNTNVGVNGEVQIPDISIVRGYKYEIIIHSDYTISIKEGVSVDEVPDMAVSYNNTENIINGANWEYGDIESGNAKSLNFVIYNTGTETLKLTGNNIIQLSGDSTFTIIQYPNSTSLEADESTSFEIEFSASTEGNYSTNLSIENNVMGKNPFQFTISVNVISPLPEIEVYDNSGNLIANGGSYDMGDATLNTSISKTFTIKNISQADLSLVEPRVIAENYDETYFTVSSYPMALIPAGMTSTFTIEFNADSQPSDRITGIKILCDSIEDYEFLVTASAIE